MRAYSVSYYFRVTRPAKSIISFAGLGGHFKRVDFSIAELKDASGESYFPKIYGSDLIQVADAIENEVLRRSVFIRSLANMFGSEKVYIYFRKAACKGVADIVAFMTVIRWRMGLEAGGARDDAAEFIVEGSPYFGVLRAFALKEQGIRLRRCVSSRAAFRTAYLIAGHAYLSFRLAVTALSNSLRGVGAKPSGQRPALSSLYTLRGLTFDSKRRCDFPWLLTFREMREQVLLYFERKDAPLTGKAFAELRDNRVRAVAMTDAAAGDSGAPMHRPGMAAAIKAVVLTGKVLGSALREVLSFRLQPICFLGDALRFAREYARAYDFYRAYNIRVNVEPIDNDFFRIPRHVALKDLGGISVSCQYTNYYPNVIFGSCADAYFIFGPYYHKILQTSGSDVDTVLDAGYITDYSFAAVREDSMALRKKLADAGARFIITYFDENSADGRMHLIPNKRAEGIYRALLDKVLADGTLGVICAPKRPKTLFKRMPEIEGLAKTAVGTGRCVFIDGPYAADRYPTESAQASDIVISLLIGGTTSLESFLSGVRALYLDLEGLYSFPEYGYGKNDVVFDDVEALLDAIDAFRRGEGDPDLGNAGKVPVIDKKDPFRDGMANRRMGGYLQSLLEAFNGGMGREEAIRAANARYAETWGREHVVRMRPGRD